MVLGHYYFTKKKWDDAINHLNKAVIEEPKDESSWIYLAKRLLFIGKTDQARSAFKEVVKIRLDKKDQYGASEIIKEALCMGLDLEP